MYSPMQGDASSLKADIGPTCCMTRTGDCDVIKVQVNDFSREILSLSVTYCMTAPVF